MSGRKNNRVKRANEPTVYTPENVMELKRCAEDPVYFIKHYVKIQHPKHGAIPFELYDYQVRMIRAYQENRFNIVLSSRQTGKALALNTPIPTPSGWTTMGDIQPGDYVFGADGNPVLVEAVSPVMHNHVCYRVVFSTGDDVIADAEHLWEVRDEYDHRTKIMTTEEMVNKRYIDHKNQARFTVKTAQALNTPHQELRVDPYTLGVWLGDGTSRCGEITTHANDLELYEYVDQRYERYQRLDNNNNKNVFRTTLRGLRSDLREYDLIQNKHIPLDYLRASFDQRLALLQGLMDTDGTVDSLGRGGCEITLANKRLARDVYQLVASLGLKPTFKERDVKGFIRYEVKFSAYRDEIEIFRLERKLELMKRAPHPTRRGSTKKRSIQKIEMVDSVPVKCIRVQNEDHLFLFGDAFIPTHNSITSGAFLLWYAIFKFDKTILIASNKNSNAMEMIHRIRYAYEELPMWLKPGVTEDGWNKHNVAFDNGSRIISTATSEDSGRGLAISLLFLDEFAFVKHSIQEEFWTSILPTLSTGGSCIMSSTPNGDMNRFAVLWRQAEVGVGSDDILFNPIRVHWDEPPERDDLFKRQTIAAIGELMWRQEYECEFLSSDALLIDTIITQTLEKLKAPVINDMNGFKFFKQPQEGMTYLVGVDPATGSGRDFSVIEVFEFPSMEQVAELRSNTIDSTVLYASLKWLLTKVLEPRNGQIFFSVENNGVGEGVIALYQNDEEPPGNSEFVSEEGRNRLGMTTRNKVKVRACLDFKKMFEKELLKINSPHVFKEIKTYARLGGTYQAQYGSTDDCIAACLIVIRLLAEIATYEQAAFDKLYSVNADDYLETNETYDENDTPPPIVF